jgi:hypothetical protein
MWQDRFEWNKRSMDVYYFLMRSQQIATQDPPGLHEIALRLNAILERSNAIDRELMTLETVKRHSDTDRRQGPIDEYRRFGDMETRECVRVPKVQTRKSLTGSTNSQALSQIMDVINDLRREVSSLATRQNEMKAELDRIRGRLC